MRNPKAGAGTWDTVYGMGCFAVCKAEISGSYTVMWLLYIFSNSCLAAYKKPPSPGTTLSKAGHRKTGHVLSVFRYTGTKAQASVLKQHSPFPCLR